MNRPVDDRGMTMVETLMAIVVALIGVFSIGSLIFQSSATSKNQGSETTRAVIYAQDKMEKLLALGALPTISTEPDFVSCTTTLPAPCNTTKVSASGWTQGLLAGGSTSPLQMGCPSSGTNVGYMDFLDVRGIQVDSCASPDKPVAYVRQWQIKDLTTTNPPFFSGGPAAKQITVAVYSLAAVNTNGGKPVVIVSSTVSNPK